MHANQPVRGAWVEGICRGSLLWIYSSSSHTILPEQVNQVEGILALAAQGYVTFGYVMHSQISQKLQNEKAKVPI